MDKKLNISIDIDGTINSSDTAISFFKVMTHLLHSDPNINIIILTNREPETEAQIAEELSKMNIQYDAIVITSRKAEYIVKNNITVVIENEDEYLIQLPQEITVFKIRESENFDFAEKKWIGSKNTTKMIDE
jgi:ribonucleotide monophosphatase NagD (HAD superfamily)